MIRPMPILGHNGLSGRSDWKYTGNCGGPALAGSDPVTSKVLRDECFRRQASPNAREAQAAIAAAGLPGKVQVMAESARTVAEAAASIGVEQGQIAKSLIFLADGDPVMVVASGDEQIDTKALAELTGKKISRADADIVRAATGYPIGGVSPAGLPAALPVFVEESLARFDEIWAAAGTHHAVFPCTYQGLLDLTGGIPSSVGVRTQ